MKSLKTLLVASTALAMVGAVSPAQARVKKQAQDNQTRIQATLDAQAAQIEELKAQLQELKAQIVAQGATQNQNQANAAQAAATADEAKAAATQAQTAATTAQAAAEMTKSDSADLAKAVAWTRDTKISGRMYFNYSHVAHEVNGIKTGNTDNGGGFNVKRFYLGVDHQFNDVFSGNLTTDVTSIAGVGQALYIKKAYLQAKINPALVIRLGATDMPWIPYVEGVYGYRHIEQTLADRTKFGTSSDWGVHVMGDLAAGLISYQVSAIDGGGYRDPHFGKTIDLEGRISAKYKGWNVAIGGYTGKLGKNLVGSAATQTYNRFNALLAYSGKVSEMPLTAGVEYFYAENKKFNSTAPLNATDTADHADGYSLFGSVGFMPKWSVFGRYDFVKPSKVGNNGLKDDYFNVGVQWSPAKIVDLALVYKREQAQNGAFSTGSLQSGVIGCSISAALTCTGKGTYDEIGLFGQFRF